MYAVIQICSYSGINKGIMKTGSYKKCLNFKKSYTGCEFIEIIKRFKTEQKGHVAVALRGYEGRAVKFVPKVWD